jgi:HNH endonuclease
VHLRRVPMQWRDQPRPATTQPATRARLRRALLGLAADTLSGPGGLAAWLRAASDGAPLTSSSLPLDIGTATETIPAHLRRAVTARHPHCAFPGCDQPATVCDIHHLIPRARGGSTSLPNLVPLCTFHHQIAIHRWGWVLILHPDGTTTATSPDGTRTLHSHSPPRRAA